MIGRQPAQNKGKHSRVAESRKIDTQFWYLSENSQYDQYDLYLFVHEKEYNIIM